MARARPATRPARSSLVGFILAAARARHFAGEALCCGNDGSRFEGKRPLDRLLDLLHAWSISAEQPDRTWHRGFTAILEWRTSYRVAAFSVFAMFFVVLLFFREPRKAGDAPPPSIAMVARNFCLVVGNARLVLPVLAIALLTQASAQLLDPSLSIALVDLGRLSRWCSPASAASCGFWCSSPATGSCSGSSTSPCPDTSMATSNAEADVETDPCNRTA